MKHTEHKIPEDEIIELTSAMESKPPDPEELARLGLRAYDPKLTDEGIPRWVKLVLIGIVVGIFLPWVIKSCLT